MRQTMIALAVLACVVPGREDLHAQTQRTTSLEDHDVQSTLRCPSVEDIERNIGRGAVLAGRGRTFVLTKNAQLYQNAFIASAPLDARPQIFDSVVIYEQARETKRLLIALDEQRCAWISPRDLLIQASSDPLEDLKYGPRPLKVGEINPADRRNNLNAKAVLNNLNIVGDAGIQAFESPEAKAVHVSLSLFEKFTVFAKANGQPRGDSRADVYFLLGKAGDKDGGNIRLVGWVHQDDLYLWSSRMAAYWAGTMRARGWSNEDLRGDPFLPEPPPVLLPTDHNVARFPILAMFPTSREVQPLASKIPESERSSLKLSALINKYRVAIPFRACRPGAVDCKSASDLEKELREYAERLERLKRLDIVFLIDATESMGEYFPSTAAAVRRFARQMLGTPDQPNPLSIRFAAYVYGDYLSSTADLFYKPLATLQDPHDDQSDVLAKLANYKLEFKDPRGDKLEAPFAALIRTANQVEWRPDAAWRIIVHVADHGNRELNQTSGEGSSLVETVGIDGVVSALQRQRIIYIPISVLGGSKQTSKFAVDAQGAFLDQSAELMRRRGVHGATRDSVIRSWTATSTLETYQQREEAVKRALERATMSYARANRLIALREHCARSPGHENCRELDRLEKGTYDVPTQMALTATAESDLGKDVINNIFSRQQSVSYAWVRPVERDEAQDVETLTYWIAVDKDRFRGLRAAMSDLCKVVKPSDGAVGIDIEQTVLNAVRVGAGEGDVLPTQSLATALSLPFWERLPVLSLDMRFIAETIRRNDVNAISKWRKAFCVSSYLFGRVEAGQKVDISRLRIDTTTDGQPVVRALPGALQPFDWLVKGDRGEEFYYIPIEFLS
jgi:hypothetical protein